MATRMAVSGRQRSICICMAILVSGEVWESL